MEAFDCGIADFSDFLIAETDDRAFRESRKQKKAENRAIRTRLAHQASRAKSELELKTLLPAEIADGESWHVISQGDIDSLSYLSHVLQHSQADYVLLSTWCMASADVEALDAWLDSGTIGRFDAYVGEIFPAHDELCRIARTAGGRVAVFRNHSKVMLAALKSGAKIVVESSANINTNPRTEQTAITRCAPLFDYYKDFFDRVKSLNRNFDEWIPYGPPS